VAEFGDGACAVATLNAIRLRIKAARI